jgi:carbamoyltransferase
MVIIGINAFHGDASACIIRDGVLLAAIEEERFTRVKHWAGFPTKAIEFCMKEAGVNFQDVDCFAIGRDPAAKWFRKVSFILRQSSWNPSVLRNRFLNQKKVLSLEQELGDISGLNSNFFKGKVLRIEHHRSHLASAFYASPFAESACLSVDGSGDFSTTMTAYGSGLDLTVLDSVNFPHSLGFFYTALTQWLGFPDYGDEYKVMGLAPYGKPQYLQKLNEVIRLTDDGFFRLDQSYFKNPTTGYISYGTDHIPRMPSIFNEKLEDLLGPSRQKGGELTSYHKDIASSVQAKTEEVIFHILRHLYSRTRCENICIAGGVAQNSVANGKITLNTPFRNVYIPSAGHDAGISMGAALYATHKIKRLARKGSIDSAFLGSSYSSEEILSYVKKEGLSYEIMDKEALVEFVSGALADGAVVGWMQGRSEFGPRALGGRSILADPRRQDAKELLNEKIKKRESFRPFAPSILKEYAEEYFEMSGAVPFMEKVYPVKMEKQAIIPAVTHVDGTGRLQTVDKDKAPAYHALIEAFRRKTGVPILLNTSFNENEPIVNSPEEAIRCFLRTKMDLLIMENVVLRRPL